MIMTSASVTRGSHVYTPAPLQCTADCWQTHRDPDRSLHTMLRMLGSHGGSCNAHGWVHAHLLANKRCTGGFIDDLAAVNTPQPPLSAPAWASPRQNMPGAASVQPLPHALQRFGRLPSGPASTHAYLKQPSSIRSWPRRVVGVCCDRPKSRGGCCTRVAPGNRLLATAEVADGCRMRYSRCRPRKISLRRLLGYRL